MVVGSRIVARSFGACRVLDKNYEGSWFLHASSLLAPVRPSGKVLVCERIGIAETYDLQAGSRWSEGVVWRFPLPRAEYADLMGMVGFDLERVDRLLVDGVERHRRAVRFMRW